MQPISPAEACQKTLESIPPFVFEAINELIVAKLSPNSKGVNLKQCDVIDEILKKANRLENLTNYSLPSIVTRDLVFERHWLDFEKHYQAAGWDVTYDRPAFNETYEPTFHFSAKE